jgi:hypothetical protein
MLNFVLDMRVLDRIANDANQQHCVEDRCETTWLDVRAVVPLECAHHRPAVDGNRLANFCCDLCYFCVAAHLHPVHSARRDSAADAGRPYVDQLCSAMVSQVKHRRTHGATGELSRIADSPCSIPIV